MNDYTLVINDDGGDNDLQFINIAAPSAHNALALYIAHRQWGESRRVALGRVSAILQGRTTPANEKRGDYYDRSARINDNCAFYDFGDFI